jgi:GMP reductase
MSYDFHQMNLIPKKCIVSSRSEVDTSVVFGNRKFNIPVIPANMECVVDENTCLNLASANYFYIYHRFNNNTVDFVKKMHTSGQYSSISIGVGTKAKEELQELKSIGHIPHYITIDIAHGHSESVKELIQWIRKTFEQSPYFPYLIVGNVSTKEAVIDLEEWGADAIKVGIGPGSACTTYNATGFGSRGAQAWVIEECAKARVKPTTKIIADGGISHPGDIAKALVLGADMVMVGGMLSGLLDSPGSIVTMDDKKFKQFWGSASSNTTGKTNRIEGTKYLIPLKDRTIIQEYTYLKECLQSAISYGGGNTIEALNTVKWFIKH